MFRFCEFFLILKIYIVISWIKVDTYVHIYINLDNVVTTSSGTVAPKFAFQVRVKLGFAGDSREKTEIESDNESIAGDFWKICDQ